MTEGRGGQVVGLERRAEEAEEEAGRVGRAEAEAQEAADERAAVDTDRCAPVWPHARSARGGRWGRR